MKRQNFKRIKDNEAKNTKDTLWQEKNRGSGKQIPKLYWKVLLKKYQAQVTIK